MPQYVVGHGVPPQHPRSGGWQRAQALPESRAYNKAIQDARMEAAKAVTFHPDHLILAEDIFETPQQPQTVDTHPQQAVQEAPEAQVQKCKPLRTPMECGDQTSRSLLRGAPATFQTSVKRPQSAQHPQQSIARPRLRSAALGCHPRQVSNVRKEIDALHQFTSSDSKVTAFLRPRQMMRAQSASSQLGSKGDNGAKGTKEVLLLHVTAKPKTDEQVSARTLKKKRLLRVLSSMPLRYQTIVPFELVEEMHDSISVDVRGKVQERLGERREVEQLPAPAESLQDWLNRPLTKLPNRHSSAGVARNESMIFGSESHASEIDSPLPSNSTSPLGSTRMQNDDLDVAQKLRYFLTPLLVDQLGSTDTSSNDQGSRIAGNNGATKAPVQQADDPLKQLEDLEAKVSIRALQAKAIYPDGEAQQIQSVGASEVQEDLSGECLETVLVDRLITALRNPLEDVTLQASPQLGETASVVALEAQKDSPGDGLGTSDVSVDRMNTASKDPKGDVSLQASSQPAEALSVGASAQQMAPQGQCLAMADFQVDPQNLEWRYEKSIFAQDQNYMQEASLCSASSCASEYVYGASDAHDRKMCGGTDGPLASMKPDVQSRTQSATGDRTSLSMSVKVPAVSPIPESRPEDSEVAVVIPHPVAACSQGQETPLGLPNLGEVATSPRLVVACSRGLEPAPEPDPGVVPASKDEPRVCRRLVTNLSKPPIGWALLPHGPCPDTHQHVSFLKPPQISARRKRWTPPPLFEPLDMAELLSAAKLVNCAQLTPRR